MYRRKIRNNEHINFLKDCKKKNVIPRGLKLKRTTIVIKNSELLIETEKQMRNNLLQWRYKQNHLLSIEINTQISILNWYLQHYQPSRDHDKDLKWMNKHDSAPQLKIQTRHEKKINQLVKHQPQIHVKNKKNRTLPML